MSLLWQRINLKQKLIIFGLLLGFWLSWGIAAWFIKQEIDHPEPVYPPAPAYISDAIGLVLVIMFIVLFSAEFYNQIRDKPIHWFFKVFLVAFRTFFITALMANLPTVASMALVCGLLLCLYAIDMAQRLLLSNLDDKRGDEKAKAYSGQEA